MPKLSSSKAKVAAAAASGPPALYGEDLSGPPLVVEVTAPSVWTATAGADASSNEECLTGGARWGHAAMLSPSESVLCIVGGAPCQRPHAAEQAPAPLWEYTSVAPSRVPTAMSASAMKAPVAAARAWKAGAARRAARQDAIRGANAGAAEDHDWPLFASWWASWPSGNGADGPAVMYADGGWSGACRIAGVRAFADGANGDPSFTLPPSSAAGTSSTRSHHSVTCVLGRLLRFGGETQQGTAAALEEIDGASGSLDEKQQADGEHRNAEGREVAVPEPTSTTPRLQPALGPPPPRAAHGACSLSQRYIVIVGGRQVHTQADDVSAVAAGASAGKGARAKKTTAMRALSPGKRGGASGKDGKGSSAALEASVPASATLTTLKDVAVYDAKLGAWLPVRVVGGGAVPCARYAAAVAAVPMPGAAPPTSRHRSPVADAVQREVLVVGGLDAEGAVCADAWLMQVMSGADAELAEVPAGTLADSASTAVPVVKIRWVRLELPKAAASVFQRHHAAVAVSSQRIMYLVGGCGPHGAAEPCACTLQLPPLTSASVRLADEAGGDAEGAVPKRPSANAKGLTA
ncbi:conserved hypothetical protein [Leishmania infantum JPCM5]|uniref:Uncharacterized protein n=2 Tax=Leishmania infantum TaxID=5671 RepID=A4HU51_LEIIN|nr:conserved hypothetical protein [Leishmania infantum JPCM5]CAC9455404.1 hypothetical_protein_-__conserved [Leishmania infantum]CAM65957.1 conserved hypothetical protein [Leishmania infantum JPCM5]SUZ39587.1 hypothetical_protein_-__conserved [Leishmania infantum]|eukprot:XP_001463592.1 conserved hypothetical protein [Leishmania infantum JPCM5]